MTTSSAPQRKAYTVVRHGLVQNLDNIQKELSENTKHVTPIVEALTESKHHAGKSKEKELVALCFSMNRIQFEDD